MTQLGHGVAALFGDWTTYALIASAADALGLLWPWQQAVPTYLCLAG